MKPEIAQFLEDLPTDVRQIVMAIRAVVLREAPGVEESLLWGGLSYHRPTVGGRVKGAVCLINVKRGAVRLEFIHGVRLEDPARLLRGNLLSKRHIELSDPAAARKAAIAALVRQAAAIEFP